MRIERLEVLPYAVPFREPYATSAGTVERRELALVRLVADDGTVGLGEAAPFEAYDGVSLGRVVAELRGPLAGALAGADPCRLDHALRLSRSVAETPQALAAVDLALHDLAARARGERVCDLLGGARRERVAVNATLPALAPGAAAEAARRAVAAGFACLKVKVGDPADEARVAAVRKAGGPGVLLRLDANGAWGEGEAIAAIERLARYELELVEQPVAAGDLGAMASVRAACGVAIAADEAVASPHEARRAIECGACDLVAVKLTSSGGIAGARAAVGAAREAGGDAYLTSTVDGPPGIAAAAHLASALGIERHCGLATLELLDAGGRWDPLPVEGGELALPEGPGLGVEPRG